MKKIKISVKKDAKRHLMQSYSNFTTTIDTRKEHRITICRQNY